MAGGNFLSLRLLLKMNFNHAAVSVNAINARDIATGVSLRIRLLAALHENKSHSNSNEIRAKSLKGCSVYEKFRFLIISCW